MHPGNNLTREEASRRAELIQTPLYDVSLDLSQDSDTFTCEATIHFLCRELGAESFIDFLGQALDSCELNGEEVPREAFNGARIRLTNLRDANELHIIGTCEYQNIGAGLCKFKDPVDHKVYLHSQFETFDAHRMFPCFDQPDLKASFTFTVLAPSDWVVVSNNPGQAQTVAGKENIKRWTFGATPKMSSYLTAIVAGPYHGVRDRHGDVDLGIFCRQSLAPYLDPDEIFTVTKQGLDFYAEAYKYPYPFQKYDQLFVPEFSAGAMENIGCVTFNESMLFRSKVTEAVREDRANAILHEMAHMWFGDLVTMRWWDDLWLNESFATFMSVLAQVEATRFKNGWVTFANQYKAGARRQDQLSSTHPVYTSMPDVAAVEVNFDGITSARGASVIKQLVACVGIEAFLTGLRDYFTKHAWGNATFDDLLSALESASGQELRNFSRQWLETAQVNTLRPVIERAPDGTYASVRVRQEAPPAYPNLRAHHIGIGLYGLTGTALVRRDLVEVTVAGEETEIEQLRGRKAADVLLLNDEDLSYTN